MRMTCYKIKEDVCDECQDIYLDTVFKELEKNHPEWRDKNGEGSVKSEYSDEWNRAYHNTPKKMCLVFEGIEDDFSLCAEHLKIALDIIKKEESLKENPDTEKFIGIELKEEVGLKGKNETK